MMPNHSPWIKQLNRTRPVVPLRKNVTTEVAIVGGGIAGVVTAFFTLRDTKKQVMLIEADRIAHGATGHNAGQITSYFERSLTELVGEFGFDVAIRGQRSVESAWRLIDDICADARLQTPLYRFTGYAGLSSFAQVLAHLENNWYRVQGGLTPESLVLPTGWNELEKIPKKYRDLYTTAPHQDLLGLLETKNSEYIAALSFQKGCMNSALFTEELIGYLMMNYPDRFSFFEGSPVKTVRLRPDGATLDVLAHAVEAARVVLCTNGFENFSIENTSGAEINTRFHHSIMGRIGYMVGYMEPLGHPPTAISYFPKSNTATGDPTGESYFYLTRRPHEHEGHAAYNLVCTGGPEKLLPEDMVYSRDESCSEEVKDTIDHFLSTNFGKYPAARAKYAFCWHGLMGYTPNGIRRVGIEPCNPVLLYNLGCNGVGILPSVYGGKRISQLLQGLSLPPSIFDLHDQRCELPKKYEKRRK